MHFQFLEVQSANYTKTVHLCPACLKTHYSDFYVVFINDIGLLITTWLNLVNPNPALSITNERS